MCSNHTIIDHEAVDGTWPQLKTWLADVLGCGDDIEGILFLIGLQESHQTYTPELEKDAKQKLIDEGAYCVFEKLGYYERVGMEADGLWIWEVRKSLPNNLKEKDQNTLLRSAILHYFDPYLK